MGRRACNQDTGYHAQLADLPDDFLPSNIPINPALRQAALKKKHTKAAPAIPVLQLTSFSPALYQDHIQFVFSISNNSGSADIIIMKTSLLPLITILVFCITWRHTIHQANCQLLSTAIVNSIINTLAKSGYTTVALLFPLIRRFVVPPVTLLLPNDNAIAFAPIGQPLSQEALQDLIQFHVLMNNFSFSDLQALPVGTLVPTMFNGSRVDVVRNTPTTVQLNNAEISQPDLCGQSLSAIITCHGINQVLQMTPTGTGSVSGPSSSPPLGGAPSPNQFVGGVTPPSPPIENAPSPNQLVGGAESPNQFVEGSLAPGMSSAMTADGEVAPDPISAANHEWLVMNPICWVLLVLAHIILH